LVRNPEPIILLALAVIVLKALVAGFVISLLGLPLRIIVLVSLALSQIGEFSFVLSKVGFDSGLIPSDIYQIFLDVTILTMAATSLLIAISPRVAEGMLRLPLPSRLKARPFPTMAGEPVSLSDHLIIVGYGVNGRNVARSAKREGIPYLIVEMDPEIVALEGKNGEPVCFGDASQEYILGQAGIKNAKVMVIAISDPSTTRRITELSRRMNPDLFIIARTRYIQEMKPLHELGANEVIPEEYETSIEIFTRILDRFQISREKIESFVAQIRADGYEMFRSLSREPYCNANISLMTEDISTLKVSQGSPIEGRPLSELGLEGYGIAPLAVHRDLDTLSNPDKGFVLKAEDVVILLGQEEKIHQIAKLFSAEPGQSSE